MECQTTTDVLKILTASRDGAKDLVASAQEYASPRERQDKRVSQGMMIRASAGRAQALSSVHSVRTTMGRFQIVHTLTHGIMQLMSARKTHNVLVIGVKVMMHYLIPGVMEDACQRGRMVWRATMTMRAHVQQANAFVIYVDLDIAKEKSVQTMITVIQAFFAITRTVQETDALVHASPN